jgi:uncharacterized repeat protein (TIGR03806 family)
MRLGIVSGLLIAGLTLGFASAQPFGIDSRASNTTLLIDDPPIETPGAMQLVRVYSQLGFITPMHLVEIPDGSGRLCVVERAGNIRVFPKNNPVSHSTFLSIPDVAQTSEQGCLSMAFDPDYATNGIFYVYYVWNSPGPGPGVSRIARFTNDDPADNAVDFATEEIILAVQQPDTNHNGGMVAIGPDGMLYWALGDGGGANGQYGTSQDTTTLLSKMIRIDVHSPPDPGLAYHIPSDNPFFDGGPDGAATRKEIWAYGFRNPFRWSFDRQTGQIFMADVGQQIYEEVNVIEKGGNYGWNRMEGFHCFNPADNNNPPPNCDMTGLTLPIAEYNHDISDVIRSGNFKASITGAYVYYGSDVPELHGMYIYADHEFGGVFGLRYHEHDLEGPFVLIERDNTNSSTSSSGLAGVGQDADGEVYFLNVINNNVYVLRPVTPPANDSFPTRLSDIPALLAAGLGQDQTANGIIPYAPAAPLWTDGALKQRFIAIPDTGAVGFQPADGWNFPDKTILIKNFLLPMDERDPENTVRRVETRLLYKNGIDWTGFSYRWNEDQSDAELLVDRLVETFAITDRNGDDVAFEYTYPSRSDCFQCHTTLANRVLGLTTPQLNSDFDYPGSGVTDNQLRTLDHIGLFSSALPDAPANLPAMPNPYDESAPLRDRARAYLASNCAQCHRAGSPPNSMDLRWETEDGDIDAIDVTPRWGDLGIPDAKLIASGDPDRSVLVARMGIRDGGVTQMPPLGTGRVDADAVELIRQYILSIGGDNAIPSGHWMMYP